MKRGRGTLRFALALAAMFGALSLVVWRQSRSLEELRALDASRSERAILESERGTLQRNIQELEGRERIVAVGARLGLHAPAASELVILRLPQETPPPVRRGARLALAGGAQ